MAPHGAIQTEEAIGDAVGVAGLLGAPKLGDEAGRLAALHRYEVLDTDPEREFEDVIRLVRGIFGVPMAAISLVAEERQWFKASVGLDPAGSPRANAFCHFTIQGTDPFAVEDATANPLVARNPLVTGDPGIRCYLGVPLTTPEGYNEGSLCVIGTEPRHFSPSDHAVLSDFGRLVVAQLELRAMARRDALTGALSRRAFDEALKEGARAGAALLLLDIDHFKVVNDRWGHPAGDAVLRALSAALAAEAGPADRLGRLGGEEFGLLLPDATPAGARALAERARARAAGLRLPEIAGHNVTLSCGVAPWRAERGTAAQWLAAADIGLYAAKRQGRDRVVLIA